MAGWAFPAGGPWLGRAVCRAGVKRRRRRENAGGLPPSWAGAQAGPRGALGRGEEEKERERKWADSVIWAEFEEEKGMG